MHILVTNDDGIESEGLKQLIEAVKPLGDVTVVAPATEQSGVGVGLTMFSPIDIAEHSLGYKIFGTPADCVRIGVNVLDLKPDLIVSGINKGPNTGRYVLSSGTVGAVIEGLFREIPGIAFSSSDYFDPCFENFMHQARSITEHVIEHPLPSHTLLNVNFPSKTSRGIRMSRQGAGHWEEVWKPHTEQSYLFAGSPIYDGEHPHGEVALLQEGYTTASPIQIFELTHNQHLLDHKDLFESRLNSEL